MCVAHVCLDVSNCIVMCCAACSFFFFKQKTAYEMRISDWSSDVCSSDLLVPAPAGVAELAPEIIVARLAAHVDHAVDRGVAAQHAPARIVQCPPVKPRLRLGLEAPVGARIILRVEVADGHVDPEPDVDPKSTSLNSSH